jgi:Putative MetA-pathway of phenol degradation
MAQGPQTGDQSQTAAEISKEASNPLSSIWLMQIQQNNNWIGMPANGGNQVQGNLQFQPLISVKVSEDWSLIARPVLQFVNTTPFQDQTGKSDRATGFGDTVLAVAVSPSRKLVGNWLLAAGPTFIFPTATDSRIGQDKWQVGPAAAFGYSGKNFITYVFPQQWFSVGDNGTRARHMLMYYAFVYAFKNGWSVGTNPAMTVDWDASRGNKVAFPVGLQVGKLRKLGILPVKFDAQVQYYAVRPEIYGPKWNLQFQMTPILPALFGHK